MTNGPTEEHLKDMVQRVRTWIRGGQRAPHKPLLLLLALGRVQAGATRLVHFSEVEERLRVLLRSYGPWRKAVHPEYPFWRLQNDGLWEVPGADGMPRRKSNTDAKLSVLRQVGRGGFPERIDSALRSQPKLLAQVAQLILNEHFPASYHAALATDAGLSLRLRTATVTDTAFRRLVLQHADGRCAVCGHHALADGSTAGLDAIPLRWTSHGGELDPSNALCLCQSHAAAFEFGALTLDSTSRVAVAEVVPKASALFELRGRHVRSAPLTADNVVWHQEQVFKGPATASP